MLVTSFFDFLSIIICSKKGDDTSGSSPETTKFPMGKTQPQTGLLSYNMKNNIPIQACYDNVIFFNPGQLYGSLLFTDSTILFFTLRPEILSFPG